MKIDYMERIYSWSKGDQSSGYKTINKNFASRLITGSSNLYSAPVPKLISIKDEKAQRSEYIAKSNTIRMVWYQYNIPTILHESAHAITWNVFQLAQHIKVWLGVFQYLLKYYDVYDVKYMKASMEAYKLPWCPLSPKMVGINGK